jgi:CRISPR system Cascade subunit CasA
VAFHGYAPAGLVKKPGEPTSASAGPLQRGGVVLVQGATLFETLLLNLLVYNDEQPLPAIDDAPSWELDALPAQLAVDKEPRRAPRGWLDLLTWQSRRVELKVAGGHVVGLIRRVGQGLPIGTGEVVVDPMMAWRRDEKRGLQPVAFEAAKAFWRDSDVLFRTREERGVVQPRVVTQLGRSEVAARVGQERRLALSVYGLTSDQAAIELTRAEHMPVSPRLVMDDAVGETVTDMLATAEATRDHVVSASYSLARHALSPGERGPAMKDMRALVENLCVETRYWTSLRVPFETFIDALIVDEKAAGRVFCAAAVSAAREALKDGARSLGNSARALKARTVAEESLGAKLKDVIKERYRASEKEKTP